MDSKIKLTRKDLPHATLEQARLAVLSIRRHIIDSAELRRPSHFDPEAHLKIVGEFCGKERK